MPLACYNDGMPANDLPLRKLSVRLPDEKLRRFKSRAAARGLSLQAATQAAVEAWISRPDAAGIAGQGENDSLMGFLAGADLRAERDKDRRLERDHERRLARLGSRARRATS